jgi:D-3-phosphoglycerate dehydrogenase
MNIIRCDSELETPHIDHTLRKWGHELTLMPESINKDELCVAMAECELLLMCYTPITSRVIASAPHLRGIVKYGVGIDAIDIPTAHARGIAVVNIPTYAEETVAEGAFAMLIALAKKLTSLQRKLCKEGWVWPTARWLGSDIAGKTVGIVGCGKIGSSMARMAGAGFRARVVGYNPNKSSIKMQALGIEAYDNLHAMLAICDFVSLHVALSDSTRHLIGAAELAAMKPTAILINTARGALVDEKALLHALQDGSIAGAGLDVFSQEPLNQKNHPLRALYSMENVILMPHLTFYTTEAMDRLESETLERCKEIIEGRPVTIRSTDPRLQGGQA